MVVIVQQYWYHHIVFKIVLILSGRFWIIPKSQDGFETIQNVLIQASKQLSNCPEILRIIQPVLKPTGIFWNHPEISKQLWNHSEMFPNIWTVLTFFLYLTEIFRRFWNYRESPQNIQSRQFWNYRESLQKNIQSRQFWKLFIRFNSLSEDNFSRLVVNFLFKPFQKLIYLAFLRQGTGCEKSQKHQNQPHFQFLLFNKTKVRLNPTQLY